MVAVMTKGKNLHHNRYFHCERSCNMNKEHESGLNIPYVKVGDFYFPNFALPPDASDIGF